MCGICGFTGRRQDQKAVIEKMMKSIEHRGPDSEGSFCGGEITLGFRRLSIIDLEDGQQPMESADGSLHIVFNGEIYDYQELREELETAGITFRTHSDTEVLVNTLQQYGEKALDKLRGMFGFAVWNEKKQTLMLARDFFGIKPVYYAQIGEHFVFASEIKSILAFPGYKREVNQLALEQYLSFQYSPLEETFFKGIYKLMPGHILLYKDGKYKIKTYFQPRLTPGVCPNLQPLQKQLSDVLEDFDLAAGLPKDAKIAGGTTKYIFRKAVSGYIPEDTDGRKKLGFPIPIRVWLRQDDWYQMVMEMFTSREAGQFFHTEKLAELLKDHKEGKKDNSRKIWTVLAFLIWYHRFFV